MGAHLPYNLNLSTLLLLYYIIYNTELEHELNTLL